MNYVFILIGLVIGFLQYAMTKTATSNLSEKKGGALGIIAVKLAFYGIVAAALLLWWKEYVVYCVAGVATGIVITAIVDMVRGSKASK